MKRKVITTLFLILILTISRYYIINAVQEPMLQISGSLDEEENVSVVIKGVSIKGFEGILDYDSEVLEYVGIEGKNNWNVKKDYQTLVISGSTENIEDTEIKDIAILKFKLKDVEDILATNISIYNIKIVKNDGVGNFENLDAMVTIQESITYDEEDYNINNNDDIIEEAVLESDIEFSDDAEIDYGEDLEVIDDDELANEQIEEAEEIEQSSTDIEEQIVVAEEESVVLGNEDNYSENLEPKETNLNVEEIKGSELNKDNLAKSKLPQTGMIVIPSIIIVALAGISFLLYKKYKSVK